DGSRYLFVEQDIPRQAYHALVRAYRELAKSLCSVVQVEHRPQKVLADFRSVFADHALLESQLDPLHAATIVRRGIREGNVPLNRFVNRRREYFTAGKISLPI